MNLFVVGLVVLAAGAALWWWLAHGSRGAAPPQPARAPASTSARVPAPASTSTRVPAAAATPPAASRPPVAAPPAGQPLPAQVPVPARLAAHHPTALDDLAADQQLRLADTLRRIPRPPPALQQLTSPAFLESASSGQLSDLIMAEGRVAAQVLAAVNAPFYGLRQPVASVGQAVTFLGLNTVRSICLKAMLEASFDLSQPALRQQFDTISRASAFASDLCGRLALKLGMAAPGTLVTQVVLSFLGSMASAALLAHKAHQPNDWSLDQDLLTRREIEQARLGLGAPALGGLLLHLWGLPATIVDEVTAIDSILVTPAGTQGSSPMAPRALCYLCARLGEQLATGALAELADYDPMADDGEAYFHLRGHLQAPALARLTEHLRATDIGYALTAVSRNTRS